MPMMHSEDIKIQEKSLPLFKIIQMTVYTNLQKVIGILFTVLDAFRIEIKF